MLKEVCKSINYVALNRSLVKESAKENLPLFSMQTNRRLLLTRYKKLPSFLITLILAFVLIAILICA